MIGNVLLWSVYSEWCVGDYRINSIKGVQVTMEEDILNYLVKLSQSQKRSYKKQL